MFGERTRRFGSTLIGMICLLLVAGDVARSEPYLQLDFAGSTYDTATETVVATTNPATLYALVNSKRKDFDFNQTFYVSAAIVPSLDQETDLGSFVFNGMTIQVTDDMVYGEGLPGHSIFPTYFTEFSFALDSGSRAQLYNVEDNPGGLVTDPAGDLYYQEFLVDISDLAAGYGIHFDLYTKNSDGTIDKNAPFSHDAEMSVVPLPAATLLGILGLGVAGIKIRRMV